jgi:hypothetical protein
MKYKTFLSAACLFATTLVNAQSIISDSFVGEFTSGSLNGQEIFGSISINDLGLFHGEALPLADALSEPAGSVGFLEELSFTFFVPAPLPVLPPVEVSFDLDNASTATPTGSFAAGSLTGFSFFGMEGSASLTAYYDATQSDISTAVFLAFNDGSGNISQGTLSLPFGVPAIPEPSSAGLLFGLAAAGFLSSRRRTK